MEYDEFMMEALKEARAAYDAGEFPVGCILTYEDDILVSGRRSGTTGDNINETDHAEMIALRRLARINTAIDNRKITLFSTLEPCLMCYGAIILSRIEKIVYAFEDVMGGGTGCDRTTLNPLYQNARISIVPNVMRSESLKLLKNYFSNPEINYWNGSLLAKYTLDQ